MLIRLYRGTPYGSICRGYPGIGVPPSPPAPRRIGSITMGSGVSTTMKKELAKPLDAVDVDTPRGKSAIAEVKRLRILLLAQDAEVPSLAFSSPSAYSTSNDQGCTFESF